MEWINDTSPLEMELINRAARDRKAISGSLELLPLCNMNCDMCYIRLSHEEMQRQGRLHTAQEWLDLAREMYQAGVLFLMLTGGEPLIFPDFKWLYVSLLEMGMIVTINTNGTLIDEEWAAFFGKHKPRRINVTLYGANEQVYQSLCHYPGGFARVLKGIRLLRENGVEVKVNGSTVKENYDDRFEIPHIAKELGAAVHTDSYMYPATRERRFPFDEQARLDPVTAAHVRVEMMKIENTPQDFCRKALDMLYLATHTPPGEEKPGKMKCRAGKCSFTINWQGMMRPCVMLTEPSIPVFEKGFKESWRILTENVEEICLSSKCSRCPLREVCNTCAACALHESGRYDGVPEYACRYTIETLNCLAAEMKKMAGVQRKENNG